jgi:hypothetical protein
VLDQPIGSTFFKELDHIVLAVHSIEQEVTLLAGQLHDKARKGVAFGDVTLVGRGWEARLWRGRTDCGRVGGGI